MDDTFDQLDQAAVAGAEGTPWPIPDLPSSTSFPVFDTFAADEPPHPSFHTSAFHPPPSSSPISIPIPITNNNINGNNSNLLKTEPIDASMIDTPPSPSFSSTATTPSSDHHMAPNSNTNSTNIQSHPSRSFQPIRSTRKRRAAAINELSTSPTSIAIGPDYHTEYNHSKTNNNKKTNGPSRKVKCTSTTITTNTTTTNSNSNITTGTDTSNEEDNGGMELKHNRNRGDGASSADTPMGDASPLCNSNYNNNSNNNNNNNNCSNNLSPNDLIDLSGTTAARSRKMTDEERKIMLHKRRLRNRASAARSREKRSRTLNELTSEVEDLMKKSARLAQQASQAVEEARKLRAKNFMLMKENELLKSELKL